MAAVHSTEREHQSLEIPQSVWPASDLEISTRGDLSFTATEDRPCISSNWNVPHDMNGYWSDGIRIGKRYFAEVAELAAKDEREAFYAVLCAIMEGEWNHAHGGHGWGIEHGFSESLAAAAILGLRTMRNGATPYAPPKRTQGSND
ncbi:hypothetical protein BCEP4_60128 [Burkholderia cepacia]|nr:hypothetical protein BCEP4_60128 [Burkholderia cepacia]